MVYTYNFVTGELIWKSQAGERDPFWCTDLIFTRVDGQCLMSPVIVHQEENYTQDIHWNLPSDWLVQNTSSGYMDMDGWMKAMSLFSRIWEASNINPCILFFGGHDSHLDDRVTHLLLSHHIYPFIIKVR